eukprot:Sspe_Gene.11271::Locus_3805_Transcript_1_1_Confidence_1.000_Length_6072::g.11271::m.11271
MPGPKRGQKKPRVQRNPAEATLPPDVVQAAQRLMERAGGTGLEDDLKRLIECVAPEQQVRVISGWGQVLIRRGEEVQAGCGEDTVWRGLLAFLVHLLFTHRLNHLQKAVVSILSSAGVVEDGAYPTTHAECMRIFGSTASKWVDQAWEELREARCSTVAPTADALSPHGRAVLRIVGDVDCLLDHPRPVFAKGIAQAFPQLLQLLAYCTHSTLRDAVSGGAVLSSGIEDCKYASRICLYLMQKCRGPMTAFLERADHTNLTDPLAIPPHPTETLTSLATAAEELVQGEHFPKDLHNTGGLMIALMAREEWLSHAFGEDTGLPAVGLLDALREPPLMGRWFRQLSVKGQLGVLRGVLNCCEESVFLGLAFTAVLPYLTPLCGSSSPDPVIRYTALQSVDLLLRKMRQSMATHQEKSPVRYDASLGMALNTTLHILVDAWEDPSAPLGHLLIEVFNAVIALHNQALELHNAVLEQPVDDSVTLDLQAVARRLLDTHWHRRGKYTALAALLPHIGSSLHTLAPDLLPRLLAVLHIKSLAHGAGALLAAYFPILCKVTGAAEPHLTQMADALLRPRESATVEGLARHGTTHYAVGPVLNNDPTLIPTFFAILEKRAVEMGDLPGVPFRLLASHSTLLRICKLSPTHLTHHAVIVSDPSVRMLAAELLCLGKKPSELPTPPEITVLEAFLTRNIKTADSAFRSQIMTLLKKWLVRCRESLHRHEKDKRPAGEDEVPVQQHILWLCSFLVRSGYATSPLERRALAIDTLIHIVTTFREASYDTAVAPRTRDFFRRVTEAAIPPEFVHVLAGSLAESWDRIRTSTWGLLGLAPSPLPGYSTRDKVEELASAAARDFQSCKIKDADAGALKWRLLHRKYTVELGWTIELDVVSGSVHCVREGPTPSGPPWPRHLAAIQNLLSRLRHLQQEREAAPGTFSPVHGILGALRNILSEASLAGLVEGGTALAEGVDAGMWRETLTAIIASVESVCSDAMRNVAGTDDSDDEDGDEGQRKPAGVDCRGHAFYADRHDDEGDRVVVINSWLAVKEACTLLADVLTTAPLAEGGSAVEVLAVERVALSGAFLVSMSLESKHNGAIAKAAGALGRVCERLLRCRIPALHILPSQWLDRLLSEGGVLSSNAARILRRSAGLPPALLAILDAEDHHAGPPVLAHRAMQSLLSVAEVIGEPGETAESPTYLAKVNALNVLKYVVEDTFLREAVLVHASRALVLALEGFNHNVWAVRNSSLILYSALMNRVVGDTRNAAGRVSLKDFLVRYHEALPTLLGFFRAATEKGVEGPAKELHPCLYPLLLLFSLLAPSANPAFAERQMAYFTATAPAAPCVDSVETACELMQLVDKAHSLKNCMGRAMAARAFAPLLSASVLPVAVRYVCLDLPSTESEVRNNATHGRLLQLEGLLQAASALGDEDKTAATKAAVEALQQRGWPKALVTLRLCPLNEAVLWKIVREHLTGVTTEWDALCAEASGQLRNVTRDVGSEEAMCEAAAAHLTLSNDGAGYLAKVIAHGGPLGGILPTAPTNCLPRGELFGLVGRMVQQATAETKMVYSIRFSDEFTAVLSAAVRAVDSAVPKEVAELLDSHPDLIEGLWGVHTRTRNQLVMRAVLRFQAVLAATVVRRGDATVGKCASRLATEVLKASHPENPTEVRRGAVEAIEALELHSLPEHCADDGIIAGLLCALHRCIAILVNDGADEVREGAAALVEAPPRDVRNVQSDVDRLVSQRGLVQAERACERCFAWIGDTGTVLRGAVFHTAATHLATILLHPITPGLSSVVFESESLPSSPPHLPYSPKELAGRANVVFEVEAVNFYAEDLYTVQLAAREMDHLLNHTATPRGEAEAFCASFMRRVVEEASLVANTLQQITDDDSKALAFGSIARLKLAAAVCLPFALGPAQQAFTILPSLPTDVLWLSSLDKAAKAYPGTGRVDLSDALFLLPHPSSQ